MEQRARSKEKKLETEDKEPEVSSQNIEGKLNYTTEKKARGAEPFAPSTSRSARSSRPKGTGLRRAKEYRWKRSITKAPFDRAPFDQAQGLRQGRRKAKARKKKDPLARSAFSGTQAAKSG